jgi:hypothetical protein
MGRKASESGPSWAVVMEGGAALDAEQVRCLLAARGLHPLVLNREVPWARLRPEKYHGGLVIVPPDEREAAGDILRDAGFLEGDLPMSRIARPAAAKPGVKRACGFCGAPAGSDSVYCDQCGQPLRS